MDKLFLIWIATQIITESFPISSSSHQKLVELFFKRNNSDQFLAQLPMHVDDVLHLVSLLVLGIFFYARWSLYLQGFMHARSVLMHSTWYVALACTMTVGWYFFLHGVIGVAWFPLPLGLLCTALLLLSLYWCPTESYTSLSWRKALIIGCTQGLALLPGISRLGSTFVVARWLQLSPRHALECSFAIHAPLIVAACARSVVYLAQWPMRAQLFTVPVGLTLVGSGLVAYLGLLLVWWLAEQHMWWVFGLYMLIPLIGWFSLH